MVSGARAPILVAVAPKPLAAGPIRVYGPTGEMAPKYYALLCAHTKRPEPRRTPAR